MARSRLGILGLLRGGRDRIEAVKSEEDDRGPGHHANFAPRRAALAESVRHERMEVRRIEHRQRDRDEHRQRKHLDRDQDGVERCAFARAGDQQAGNHPDDEDRRDVEDAAQLGTLDQRIRQAEADRLQEPRRIAGPADRHGADHQRIFEDQRDADHPRDQLAEHDVGIGISRARRRDHRRNLGVSERRAGADQAGDREGQDDRRTGLPRPDPDQSENAGANDRAHTERDEVRPRQCLLEPMLFRHVFARDDRLAHVPVLHGQAPLPSLRA